MWLLNACSSPSSCFVSNMASWMSVVMLVYLINLILLGLVYMFSKMLSSPSLESKVKEEVLQLISSALLIVMLGIVISMGDIYVSGIPMDQYIGQPLAQMIDMHGSVSVFDVDYAYLIALQTKIKSAIHDLISKVRRWEWFFNAYFGAIINGVNIPFPSQAFLGLWSDMIKNYVIAEQYMWLSITGYFILNLLLWVESSMLSVYLPLGLVLRMFPPTRAGGATLIAMVVGLYFIFPYMLAYLYLSGPGLGVDVNGPQSHSNSDEAKVCPLDPFAIDVLYQPTNIQSISNRISIGNLQGFNVIRLYGFYYPLVAFVSTLLISRSFAQILGGDLGGMGRSILRLA